MENKVKTSRNWSWLFVPALLYVVGLGILIYQIVVLIYQSSLPLADATVTEIDASSFVITVSYLLNGASQAASLDRYVNGLNVGQIISVRYDASRPSKVYYVGGNISIILFIVVGLLFVAGTIILIREKRKQKRNQGNLIVKDDGSVVVPAAPEDAQKLRLLLQDGIMTSFILEDGKGEVLGNLLFKEKLDKRNFIISDAIHGTTYPHVYQYFFNINNEDIVHVDGDELESVLSSLGVKLQKDVDGKAYLMKGKAVLAIYGPLYPNHASQGGLGKGSFEYVASMQIKDEHYIHEILLASLGLTLKSN